MALRMSKRLQKEFESIQKNNQQLKVLLPNNDLTLWHVSFPGAKGTLYEGENFTLQLRFNNQYPIESPQVIFIGHIPVHQHIYSNGFICLSILYDCTHLLILNGLQHLLSPQFASLSSPCSAAPPKKSSHLMMLSLLKGLQVEDLRLSYGATTTIRLDLIDYHQLVWICCRNRHFNLYYYMAWRDDSRRRIVIDSGSYSIRLGNASTPVPSFVYDNFIAIDRNTGSKIFGPQLENILDETKLIYQKNNVRGVTVRFEAYVNMLDQLMAKLEMPKKTTGFYCEDYSMTLPILPYHPRKVMERHMEIYLQYFRFDGIFVKPSSQLIYDHARALYNPDLRGTPYTISDKYALIVESSESATYITPYFEGKPVKNAIRRLDVGGKLLTNYLKEILSFRHLDLKNSDRLIKQIKEDLCFVSQNLIQDMRCKRGTFLKHFVMPDDQLKKKGYAVDIIDESIYTQHISLDKQRFQIPEILFAPQDIGLEEKGITGAIIESLKFTDQSIRHNYLQNIILTGGNTRFSGFSTRLYEQIKKNSFCWIKPRIYSVNNIHAGYQAAVFGTNCSNFGDQLILKDWYRQQGPNRVNLVLF